MHKTGLTVDQAIEKTFELLGYKITDDEMSEVIDRRFLSQDFFAETTILYDKDCSWVDNRFAYKGKPTPLGEYIKAKFNSDDVDIMEQAFMIDQPDTDEIISKAAAKITDHTFGRNGKKPSMEMFSKIMAFAARRTGGGF